MTKNKFTSEEISGSEKALIQNILTNTILSMLRDEIHSEVTRLTTNQVANCTMLKSAKYVCALRKSVKENIKLLK